jgi:hypothetical protein
VKPEVYLRYSHGPEADARDGPSHDYEADLEMTGWSVTTLRPEAWWLRPAEDWVARRICKYLDLGDADDGRRPWLLTGKVVGAGPDHEPLVQAYDPVGWLGDDVVNLARRLYRDRFNVGCDSA